MCVGRRSANRVWNFHVDVHLKKFVPKFRVWTDGRCSILTGCRAGHKILVCSNCINQFNMQVYYITYTAHKKLIIITRHEVVYIKSIAQHLGNIQFLLYPQEFYFLRKIRLIPQSLPSSSYLLCFKNWKQRETANQVQFESNRINLPSSLKLIYTMYLLNHQFVILQRESFHAWAFLGDEDWLPGVLSVAAPSR